MNKYRELLDYAKGRGLLIEAGSKHTKILTPKGRLVQVLSGNSSTPPRYGLRDQIKMLEKNLKKAEADGNWG